MARRRAAAVALAAALLAVFAPHGASGGAGDAAEVAALKATNSKRDALRFPPEPGAAFPSGGGAASPPSLIDSTPQQRLAIAILTLKSAFVEPNVNSNDAVCNPDDAPDPCEYVLKTDDCESTDQRINYLKLHYCTVVAKHRSETLAIIALFLWMMLVFTALSLSADMFFAPAVANIADWLRLSDDVAGATLLAFGNGAPDFFTQVAAITHGKSVDLPLALGEGVGAGMYVSCFCLAVSVLYAPAAGVPVPPGPFLRDVVGYLGGFIIVIWAAMDKTINTSESCLFILWYCIYVAVVLFGGRYVPALATRYVDHVHALHDGAAGGSGGSGAGSGGGGSGGGVDLEMAELPPLRSPRSNSGGCIDVGCADGVPGGGGGSGAHAGADEHRIGARHVQTAEQRVALSTSVKRAPRAGGRAGDEGHDDGDEAPERPLPLPLPRGSAASPAAMVGAAITAGGAVAFVPQSEPRGGSSSDAGPGGDSELGSYWQQLRAWAVTYSGVRDPHAVRWALPFTAPVRLVLSVTMADPSGGTVSPVHLALIAFCCPPFLLFTAGQNIFRLGDSELLALTLLRLGLVGAALGLLPRRGLPAASSGLVSAVAFLGGVAWMDVCADEIVSIFQALGRILGLPEALLGGTIMCWAASMGDLVATVAVVKRGMANMAVTSCFAGPVFQLLCGLGCSLLFINVGRGVEVPIILGGNLRLMFAFAVGVLSYYVFAVPLIHKNTLTRRFAKGVLVTYILFVALYSYVGLRSFES